MGVALAWLAWRIGGTGGLHHEVVAAVGVFGSVVYGAAPLTVLPATGSLGFPSAVGAIPPAWWLILLGAISAGRRAGEHATRGASS